MRFPGRTCFLVRFISMPSPTHLFKACEQGDFSTLITHLQSLSPSEVSSIRDEHQATLVHYACRYGYLPILQYLVEEKHLDLRQLRTEHGATGAHDAAVCDQLPILRYIFRSSKQLQWTVRDELGNTPLHLAASYNSVNVVHYLLHEESADPHHPSYNGLLALHYASEHGHHDCIKLLLDKAPDTINQQTSQLCTALHLACQNGLIDTMHLLISRGANFKVKDQNGANCLHIGKSPLRESSERSRCLFSLRPFATRCSAIPGRKTSSEYQRDRLSQLHSVALRSDEWQRTHRQLSTRSTTNRQCRLPWQRTVASGCRSRSSRCVCDLTRTKLLFVDIGKPSAMHGSRSSRASRLCVVGL